MAVQEVKGEYLKRINNVLDYLGQHYGEDVNLEQLAKVANFSPFHFHRIFTSITGEPLNKYVQRIRIEKAAGLLKYQALTPISDIAIDCGFASSASFARVFKQHYGVSASEWRKGASDSFSKIRKAQSKDGEALGKAWQTEDVSPMYIDPTTNSMSWEISMRHLRNIQVEVKHVSEVNLAYIRHLGEFKGEKKRWIEIFQRLVQWASSRDLVRCPGTQYYTVFRDDLNITDFSKFKTDLCISVEKPITGQGEVCAGTIPKGKYAVAYFEIDAEEYEQAWNILFDEWLPKSGYQPDQRCCFERYLNDPKMHPQNKHMVEMYLPVKPL